jgi:hypothetical protein
VGSENQCPTVGDWDKVSLSENLLDSKPILDDT